MTTNRRRSFRVVYLTKYEDYSAGGNFQYYDLSEARPA